MRAVELVEVSARDGLQNEPDVVDTATKVELVRRAVDAGARRLEVASFVSPTRVPQMADAEAVLAAVPRRPDVRYAGLVLNARGLARAAEAGVDEVNVVVVVSDTFCRRNQGADTAGAVETWGELAAASRSAGITPTVTLAAAFGCPFEGEVAVSRLADVAASVVAAAVPGELALADTIGVAVPTDVTARVEAVRSVVPPDVALRLHLHDTRHTGVANAVAGFAAGVDRLDASLGGLGGCPFAPAATGNVATEDLAYAFDRMGVRTGLDLDLLTDTVRWLQGRLGRPLPGAIARAGGFPRPAEREALHV